MFCIKGKAMSNETDLDWLARNVHVWCLFCDTVAIVHDGEVTFHEPNKGLANAITIDQWVARRAELHGVTKQFKPSIEEANRLAQEFKPFISIEDNQEQEGINQKTSELEMLAKVSHLISDKRHRITPSKYTKTIRGVSVDVYDVLMAWGVTNPALQHLIKKALQCGKRGHKDNEQDLQDIIDSAIRAKELG